MSDKAVKAATTKLTKAVEGITDELKAEVERIKSEVEQLDDDNIDRRYKIGQQLVAIVDDDTGKYGDNPAKALKSVMPLSKDGLRPMMEFARAYTQTEVKDLRDLRNPVTKERLTWSHIVILTRVKDKKKVKDLAKWAVEEGKTTRELVREAMRQAGGAKSAGGRKHKKSASLEAGLDDLLVKIRAFTNYTATTCLAPVGGFDSLYASLASSPGWRPSDELTTKLAEAKAAIDQLVVDVMTVGHAVSTVEAKAKAARTAKTAA